MAMADNIVMPEMTWTEVDEAMKDRPVALLPVGATEAHGPHLPLAHRHRDRHRDGEARRGQAEGARGDPSLILPPVAFTVAEFGADFAGTLSVPAETVGRPPARRLRGRGQEVPRGRARQHPPRAGPPRVR